MVMYSFGERERGIFCWLAIKGSESKEAVHLASYDVEHVLDILAFVQWKVGKNKLADHLLCLLRCERQYARLSKACAFFVLYTPETDMDSEKRLR